ncbi:protein-tyrosine phosphatase-like protein [Gamsiella multidivaricata]|uniref:protein-tyrosine phosphatase-like protein n=1 Tax=Gamsiella multidivaricata TaxID=101098 RepID=UPI00221EC4F1|nr:protein-tyrosine phosphatase-like protein [Gamsiella multidivaricata]KAI7829432.1 protein-tyrosine phosphatase-like protein [Gamsiella multidivaricata]
MTFLSATLAISTSSETELKYSPEVANEVHAKIGPMVESSIHTNSSVQDTEDKKLAVTATGPFQGDGADPSQAELLIPQQFTVDWLAYSVSLNYNRLATSVFSPITHWHWYDPVPHSSLILGAVPSQHLLAKLKQEYQVEDIVNMCAEFKGHLETMRGLGLVQCWIPTRDFHTPSVENIWTGVRFIVKCDTQWQEIEEVKRGRIYIHCKAGRGRSATVVLCWLVYCYKLTTQEAQRILLKARAQARRHKYLSASRGGILLRTSPGTGEQQYARTKGLAGSIMSEPRRHALCMVHLFQISTSSEEALVDRYF